MADEVILPALGQTTNELTICAWEKREGDYVHKGEVLLTVETDKAIVDVQAFTDGILQGIRYQEGETVIVGSVLAWLHKENEDSFRPETERGLGPEFGTPKLPSDQPPIDRTKANQSFPWPLPVGSDVPALPSAEGWTMATPLARALAKRRGTDLARIQESSIGGVVKAADVERHVSQVHAALQAAGCQSSGSAGSVPPPATTAESHADESAAGLPAPASGLEIPKDKSFPLSRMRHAIAERLSRSKQTIPHYYVTAHVNVTSLVELREKLQQLRGFNVSYNSFVIRAVCFALRQYPAVNASLEGDEVVEHGRIGIGFAVEVPDGLRVPIVHDADQMNVWELTTALKQVAERARGNQLTARQVTGGTFTVSSLGMFGVDEFSAIINPPEAAILAVGRIADRPVVADGAVVAGKMLSLTLSVDHRIVDGALAGRFLQAVREELEQPLKLLTPILTDGGRGPYEQLVE